MQENTQENEIESFEHSHTIMAHEGNETRRWQHEETGRIIDMAVSQNPGRRWYLISQ